ncbi:MAG: 2,3-diphosphoglycerate-dependent phosphoglycerate mutase [Spirochaetales bacterium]|nr:2,3-diphosphoglycerate-dependent phosphoglycerate mutase [Spirochaetales bacterium]
MKVIMIRHGESTWNRENRFTGWTDVDLSDRGREEAAEAVRTLKEEGFTFDIAFTSYLRRAINTLNIVLDGMDLHWIEVIKAWQLNERHYGALQGLNKPETAAKFGEAQVKIWRRSYDVPPPALESSDPRNPEKDPRYAVIPKGHVPLTECLKDVVARVIPYWEASIWPLITSGKRVLISAHGNSLRALVKHLDHMNEKDVVELNIPTGIPLLYDLNPDGTVKEKRYLGDQEKIQAEIEKVANQGKVKK